MTTPDLTTALLDGPRLAFASLVSIFQAIQPSQLLLAAGAGLGGILGLVLLAWLLRTSAQDICYDRLQRTYDADGWPATRRLAAGMDGFHGIDWLSVVDQLGEAWFREQARH